MALEQWGSTGVVLAYLDAKRQRWTADVGPFDLCVYRQVNYNCPPGCWRTMESRCIPMACLPALLEFLTSRGGRP